MIDQTTSPSQPSLPPEKLDIDGQHIVPKLPWKVILFSFLSLVISVAIFTFGVEVGKKKAQPLEPNLFPTKTLISTPLPTRYVRIDLGEESFTLERLTDVPFVARVTVLDIFSFEPIEDAQVKLTPRIECSQVEGAKCLKPQFSQTTNQEGQAIFKNEIDPGDPRRTLKDYLEGDYVPLVIEASFYEKYTHEIPLGKTPIDITVKILGSKTAKVTDREQAFRLAEENSVIADWLNRHEGNKGFNRSAKFENPYWLIEYADKSTCPQGYDLSDPECVLQIKINAQTGEITMPAL